MMRTLAEFNGIHDPKINLIQVFWDLNLLITMEDLFPRQQDYKPKNGQFFEELKVQSRTKIEHPRSRLQC